MPVRWAWGTNHPTICQNCAGKAAGKAWFERCYRAIQTGHFSDVAEDEHSSYSVSTGRFERD